MSGRRDGLAPDERRARSQTAAARLLALPEVAALGPAAGTVAGYVAMRGELDPAPALQALQAAGARIALPRVSSGARRLRFFAGDDGRALCAGPYGLMEPDPACAEVPVEAIDVVLVPGLAFDAAGRRVGYGGGYYDEAGGRRRAAGGGLLIGLGYDFQVVERCPADERDVPVDLIVTDLRVLRAPLGRVPAPGGDA